MVHDGAREVHEGSSREQFVTHRIIFRVAANVSRVHRVCIQGANVSRIYRVCIQGASLRTVTVDILLHSFDAETKMVQREFGRLKELLLSYEVNLFVGATMHQKNATANVCCVLVKRSNVFSNKV